MLKVSIIIPIYNAERFLSECIDSALNQTMDLDEYEIILVNNSSTDNSKMIAEEYERKNKNIRLINQDNRGPGGSINTGLKNAKGKYVYILHSDDIMKKELLRKCYCAIEEGSFDFISFDYQILYDGVKKLKQDKDIFSIGNEEKVMSGKEFLINYLWVGPEFARMFNSKFILNNNLLFDESLSIVDFEAYPRMCLKAKKVKHINENLYIHRQSKYNDSHNLNILKFINTRQIALYKLFDIINTYIKDKEIRNVLVNYSIMELHGLLENILLMRNLNIDMLLDLAINQFLNKYRDMYSNNQLTIHNHLYLRDVIELNKNAFASNSNYDKSIDEIKEIVEFETNNYKRRILKNIPFDNESYRIGIYGMGTHTSKMISYYEKYIGDIKASIIFIDSIKGMNNERFKERDVINIKDVRKNDLNCIVVSSCSYEQEIIDKLKEHKLDSIPIYTFYRHIKYPIFK